MDDFGVDVVVSDEVVVSESVDDSDDVDDDACSELKEDVEGSAVSG